MAGTISSFEIKAVVNATFTGSSDLSTVAESLAHSIAQAWASGTGTNQVNQLWSDQRTAAAAADNLDLYGGLTDVYGGTLNFTGIRGILIHNKSTTSTENLEIGGNFMESSVYGAAGDLVTVGPNGVLLLTAPTDVYTVTNTTADVLSVDPGADTITYDIILAGTV